MWGCPEDAGQRKKWEQKRRGLGQPRGRVSFRKRRREVASKEAEALSLHGSTLLSATEELLHGKIRLDERW